MMLKMKKINYTIVILLGLIILFGCTNKYYFNGTWVRNEDTISETIYFGEDGHFSYYTSEGNAVETMIYVIHINIMKKIKK